MFRTLKKCLRIVLSCSSDRISNCACCGSCCEAFGGHLLASRYDIERWRQQGRNDLLARVNHLGWIWVNPDTGKPEERCPFIVRVDTRTALCGINDTKPAICRDYPTLAHGRRCIRTP